MNRMQKTDGPVDLRDLPSTGETHASLRLSKIGPYRLGRAVGRGKTGITYEAVHVEQGRKVALKILDRNLKPGNILVDASSRAYVTDFGSAKRMGPEGGQSSHLFQGGIVGSPS